MSDDLELDPDVHAAITEHARVGDELAEAGRYEDALNEYNKGWELIPEPQNDWEAATWILGAIGDAAFLGGFFGSARRALEYAMTCPGGLGNPFLHLRLGEVLFETGEMDMAADELMRAWMGAGAEIYADEDPKYLAFLKTRAIL